MPFIAIILPCQLLLAAYPHYGRQFVGWTDFTSFTRGPGGSAGETVFVSTQIVSQIQWDQLIVSWNADAPPGAVLKIEARAIYPDRATRFYTMGIWSGAGDDPHRMSVKDQKDDDGEILTDTLGLKVPCDRAQIRLTW